MNNLNYDALDKEAHDKYEVTKLNDPYPEIQPALLSASDIVKYVTRTGMIVPFHNDKQQLKQAAYAVKMLGKCIFWDDDGKKQELDIKEKDEFILKRNSIAFVSLEPRFRIPYYMALRFNLQILHIHRGILLGTGPLIDPGFDGKLAIPLHNLTMNDYTLRGGDDLIWIEFTKLNMDKELLNGENANYVEFRPDKKINDINDYLHKAYHGHPIRSSLSEIKKVADDAMKRTNIITWTGVATALGLIIGFAVPGIQLVTDSNNYVKGAKEAYKQLTDKQEEKIKELQKRLEVLENSKKTTAPKVK